MGPPRIDACEMAMVIEVSRGRRLGLNMVEVLVALVIVGIITTTMFAFVNDYHQRYRLIAARADLNRIAEAIQLAEQRTGQRVLSLSSPRGGISTLLAPHLMDLRDADPWGNRFIRDSVKKTFVASATGDPYVIDVGLGRILSAGPDGILNTKVGQDPPDTENDILIDYKRRPWVAYSIQGRIYLATADGAAKKSVKADVYANVAISPDGNYFAGVKSGNSLVVGTVDEANAALKVVVPRSGFTGTVNQDTFPVFYPNSGSILFLSNLDLYRYDVALDLIVPLTLNKTFGGSDSSGNVRSILGNGRATVYSFTDSSQTAYALTISLDGKVAFSKPGTGSGGLFLVSAAGGDMKMIKKSDVSNKYLPVTWIGTDTLIYVTNPAVDSQRFFYRMNQDGGQDIVLHRKAITAGISLPTPSGDSAFILFFTSDSTGAVLRTDGSGFLSNNKQTNYRSNELDDGYTMFSWSQGLNTSIGPAWTKDSKLVHFLAKDGAILQLSLDPTHATRRFFQPQSLENNATGGDGLRPAVFELNNDETLFAVVSSAPAGLFIVPVLGPDGARTHAHALALAAGEVPIVRWLDRQ